MWVGSTRYDFVPGRDVTVGIGDHCDIPLEPEGPVGPEAAAHPILVLRFAGTHWLAVDQSHRGLFLDGARMSTIDVQDGQMVAIGDPQHGPRLMFQVAAPSDAPPPRTDPLGVSVPAPSPLPSPEEAQPDGPPPLPEEAQPLAHPSPLPEEPPTGRMAVEPETRRLPAVSAAAPQPIPVPEPPVAAIPAPAPLEPETTQLPTGAEPETTQLPTGAEPETTQLPTGAEPETTHLPTGPVERSPLERPTNPFRYVPVDATASDDAPAKGRGLVERMAGAGRKLLPTRAESGPDEPAPQTGRLPLQPGARTLGVTAHDLGLVINGREVLSNISFTTPPGSLIAVVGPSPARNFALTGLLAGTRPLSSGVLTVDGHDVHAEPETMRSRIGVVTRDNRVHPSFTVERALDYAAELRLPSNTSPENRERVIDQVLDELELTAHRGTRIAKLPPEARRCASLAVELLTRPSLLIVNEPGEGLDPAQANHVLGLLRRQADLGCVVVVASTSLIHVDLCDQVLLLTPAGQLAFAGPPAHIEPALGTRDWYQIFARISADPLGAHRAFLVRQHGSISPSPPPVTKPERLAPAPGFGRQFRLLAGRQLRLMATRPIYSLLLLLLPFALGALTLLIPGDAGLNRPDSAAPNTHEALEILAALNFAAVLLGTFATIGDLVAERRVFRREQAVGLSTSAYLLAKLVVFSVIAAVQAAILTTVVVVGKGGPRHGAVLLGNANVELYVSVAATAVVSAIVGLALSSLGRSKRETLPLAIPAVLASLLFAGGLVSLVGTWGYDQVSWFVPAQWGFAASAATVNLRRVEKLAPDNLVWTHYSGWWVFDMLMLLALGALWAGFLRYRLRPPAGGGYT
ncbi:ABC transporter ATP-binding protein [Mycobacterium asiaticum]|uniref:ABC transporter ATP-binding protein n=1 Tax=Mycobacterium asiaticum TaxID=1790 RepID=A0A1A3NE11_MYCAS|nr:ABC transporter permease [Mycobacterium asiaticum]OBK19550.1 ABC transporter ATP-binding protein [Mycobacterium asiaticum]